MEKISRSAIRRFDAFGEFEDEMGDEDKNFEDAGDPRLFEDRMACDSETVRVGEEEPAVAMNDEEHHTSSNENAGATSDEEQPDSSNENESAKMHRYMAAGSFASRELLRQTYDQFFDHQRYKRTPAFQRDQQHVSICTKFYFFFRKISSRATKTCCQPIFRFFRALADFARAYTSFSLTPLSHKRTTHQRCSLHTYYYIN